jgi:hypothetical protein
VWRWQLVIRILGSKAVGFGPLALLLGHSLLIGQVLPSSVGGDVARTVLLSRSTGAAAAARSVICDRLLGFAALALLVVPTIPVMAKMIGSVTPFLRLTICALGTMTAVALVTAYSLTYGLPWIGRHLATGAGDLRITLRSGKIGLVAMALGIGSSLLGVLLVYLIGSAIGAICERWTALFWCRRCCSFRHCRFRWAGGVCARELWSPPSAWSTPIRRQWRRLP